MKPSAPTEVASMLLIQLTVFLFVAGARLVAGPTNAISAQASAQGWEEDKARKLAGRFIERLNEGHYELATEDFDETMKRVMPSPLLLATWAQIQLQSGEYQELIELSARPSGGYLVLTATCQFEESRLDIVLPFDRSLNIAGLRFQPAYASAEYVDTKAFDSLPERIGESPWELPATLTMPQGDGPFPALVLVHGSGPQDRDESIGPNRIFCDLAEGLSSRGIAVIRFDKRTLVHGEKIVALWNTTVREESIDDALLAVQLLRDNSKIDPTRIHVLGHSWGGYLLPRIVEEDREQNIASAIVFAGNTRSLSELLEDQYPYLLALEGSLSDADKAVIAEQNKLAATLRDRQQLNALNEGQMISGGPRTYFLDLLDYKPEELAVRVFTKALVLQGERDYQVTMDQDFTTWKKALAARPGIEFKSYPKLNHLFVSGSGKSTPDEYRAAGNVDVEVIDDIAEWIESSARRL